MTTMRTFEMEWTHPETGRELLVLFELTRYRDESDGLAWWSIVEYEWMYDDKEGMQRAEWELETSDEEGGPIWEKYGAQLREEMIEYAFEISLPF